MKNFSQLKKNLHKDFSNLKPVRLALLGDTATQLLTQALRGMGYETDFDLQIFEADFDQIERQIFDPNSELYTFNPEIIIVFQSSHKLLNKYNKLNTEQHTAFAENQLASIEDLYNAISTQSGAKILYYNYTEIDDAVFGSYANKTVESFLYQLRKLNYELMVLATAHSNFYICDISSIQNSVGKINFYKPSMYINAEMVLSIDVLPEIAKKALDLISALNGKFHKCLILDLDNTLWGGVIGDDGLENIQIGNLGIGKAFTEFQYWIKKLKDRGIIICICSKNTESIAKEPFEKHPDMVLRLHDIAVFIANWENKTDNIKHIQSILNIGFDSIVFLDDNPFERNMVRENIAGITIPELPEDPADYLEYLYSLNLFETVSFSGEDAERTKLYQVEARRTNLQKSFTSEDDFLQSLNMVSVVEPFNKFNTPRVAQLSQRSNQFNLRTVRYTEADIEKMAASKECFTFTFTLEDKFGDNGLICTAILKKENAESLFIDTWFMSCRVLKRGMEEFVLNEIINTARIHNFKTIIGEYLPTQKNIIVKDLYKNSGFKAEGNRWKSDVAAYTLRKNYITKSPSK